MAARVQYLAFLFFPSRILYFEKCLCSSPSLKPCKDCPLFASELSQSVGRAGVTLRAVRVREWFPGLVTTRLVISANGRVFAPGTQHLFGVRPTNQHGV
ncbi:hypothetical protein E2C01_031956 [Portunus trituberculatus]|uniref:Uncharacterized protein n=1 Tax=Portunus trituberculatus TaxID=210409 RepID=A0A5B7EZK2_PORTR|nr:hypothetical protein [Portunus trituberculatus]